MVLFTLGTQITWTRYTMVRCVPRTLRTLMYFVRGACCGVLGACCDVLGACCVHDVGGLGHNLFNENKEF